MSLYESSYKSLLQGVSQQQPEFRLDGQLETQENMLSDAATGLRRRPGAKLAAHWTSPTAEAVKLHAQFVELGGQAVHVFISCATGVLTVTDTAFTTLATIPVGTYLTAADIKSIRTAVVGDTLFVCNVEKRPTVSTFGGDTPYTNAGFFWIKSGAFNTKYSITLSNGAWTHTETFTTPDGSGAGHAAFSTPANIAENLHAQFLLAFAGLGRGTFYYTGNAVGFKSSTVNAVEVSTDTSGVHIGVSGQSYVRTTGDLPQTLPFNLDFYTVAVGSILTPAYYRWDTIRRAWLECPVSDSGNALPKQLQNMPVRLFYSGGAWDLSTVGYLPRTAGDAKTSPDPAFLTRGITGIAAYMGRLVLLAGSFVCMSAAGKPVQFYRSTVEDIIDSDPIEVGAVANSAASYAHAVQYNKDLLVFSTGGQAVLPGAGGITPRTATLVVTSDYPVDITAAPRVVGRSLMYASPRSGANFGLLELSPSPATESQYVSSDATAHLPSYTSSTCRFMDSSGVSGIAVFGLADMRTLLVHEYLWSMDTKVQQAWHKWTFPADIAWAYFVRGVLHIAFVTEGSTTMTTLDVKGLVDTGTTQVPFLDMYAAMEVSDHLGTIPTGIAAVVPTRVQDLQITEATGVRRGERVGVTNIGLGLVNTVASYSAGSTYIGIPYISKFRPTPPIVKDREGIAVSTNKLSLLRYTLTLADSTLFSISASDYTNKATPIAYDSTALYWDSQDLVLGARRVALDARVTVPLRLDAPTSAVEFASVGPGEFNIKTLEYACRTMGKIRRR